MLQALTARRRELSERDDGFSLIELIVAMVIIAIILVFLIGAQLSAMRTVSDARKREQATAFANEAMEQMRAIPWAVLAGGLDTNFNSGGSNNTSSDTPDVSGTTLQVDGQSRQIRTSTHVFASTDPTVTLDPLWTPIFVTTDGSNVQTRTDPSVAGTVFTVKAYVLEPTVLDSSIVSLAAVVEWLDTRGHWQQTVMWSEAFRGDACNSAQESVQPYLTGCEAYYSSESSSGTYSSSVDAEVVDPLTTTHSRTNLLYPTSNIFYSLFVKSASTSSILESQQVTNTTAYLQYGSSSVDDNVDSTQVGDMGWLNGGTAYQLSASNDVVSPTPADPSAVTVSSTDVLESERSLTASGALVSFRAMSDKGRSGSLDAAMTTGCLAGIPADSGCSVAKLTNNSTIQNGSTYLMMTVNGTDFRLSRRLSESSPNVDQAWTARFPTAPASTGGLGCAATTDSGCVSAGASRTSADISVGKVLSGNWTRIVGGVPDPASSAAHDGLFEVTGTPGQCSDYTESVLAERGVSQPNATPQASRCGTLSWWTGDGPNSGYSSVSFDENTDLSDLATQSIEPVMWTSGIYTVSATGGFTISAAHPSGTSSDPTCVLEACTGTIDGGTISIVVTYTITDGVTTYNVTSTTVLGGMRASATYLEPSDA
ncbi:prepilin-type N-terminal cleavage/methylation domain-containing protein [Demequina capsici]|uniref:Prepilin-type N-terminal cleavage/methylation domain-containing protein n=1 Tax=Demequina capsici TaxID=3075620 RepID=A0AA96FFT4_9MICO|nr:prepilin-type N-terminal cleavage/methylation domain-containing protein [Demequina sp. PMTSA13]WNM28669.1 prepilin-type N-terminal cleavage/methylation domain-containing protein [Demequina sp. PMTSA13]